MWSQAFPRTQQEKETRKKKNTTPLAPFFFSKEISGCILGKSFRQVKRWREDVQEGCSMFPRCDKQHLISVIDIGSCVSTTVPWRSVFLLNLAGVHQQIKTHDARVIRASVWRPWSVSICFWMPSRRNTFQVNTFFTTIRDHFTLPAAKTDKERKDLS